MNDRDSGRRPGAGFPTTHWSRVAAAGDADHPEGRQALAELCAAYWYPVYALIRRRGHSPDEAADLAQDYFARLLEKGTLAAADPAKGRFRTFLRTDCGFFLADARDHRNRLKRGGGVAPVSIDARDAEGRYVAEPVDDLTADRLFDRDWALAVLERAMRRLGDSYARGRRPELFDRLRDYLTAEPEAASYAETGRSLGMTAGAVQVAVHRMRGRFAATLRDEVAATLDDPTPPEVEEEVRALFGALGG